MALHDNGDRSKRQAATKQGASQRGAHARPAKETAPATARQTGGASGSQSLPRTNTADDAAPYRRTTASGYHSHQASVSRASHRKGVLALIVVLAAIVIALALWVAGAFSSCSAQQTVEEGTQVEVTVPEGASTKDIASLLYDAKLIATTGDFASAVDRAGASTSLKPGTYEFTGGTSADDLVAQMEQGPSVDVVTIPEGSTLKQTAKLVAQATDNRITAKAFRKQARKASSYANDYSFIKDASYSNSSSSSAPYGNSLEGFLFPKTYNIKKTATADDVIRMMLDQYQQETASLDYSQAKKSGLTRYEVLILASMVEKEAAADNRATVASVFYNRLKKDMPLQSDATVAYAVGHDPSPSDLKVDSPYNTYLSTGLPAGPICSPGLDSLQAACQPDDTDYYYFYFATDASGQMQYYFSKTYKQHQAAIRKAAQQSKSSSSDSEGSE